MPDTPYTREELAAAHDGRWPDRGLKCDCCGVHVPVFAELSEATHGRLIELILEGKAALALAELIAATGAPQRFAKIWVLHSGQPKPRFSGPPCPQCGAPLASSRAKQCLKCHADWALRLEALTADAGLGRNCREERAATVRSRPPEHQSSPSRFASSRPLPHVSRARTPGRTRACGYRGKSELAHAMVEAVLGNQFSGEFNGCR
jgi:hypothetical protein